MEADSHSSGGRNLRQTVALVRGVKVVIVAHVVDYAEAGESTDLASAMNGVKLAANAHFMRLQSAPT